MSKNKNTTIFILAILCFYFLFSQFYLKNLGKTFIYLINPIVLMSIAMVLKISLTSTYKTEKYKKTIMQYTIITALVYIILLLVSGLFLTYGENFYATSFKGLMLNMYSMGLVTICLEYIRFKLINNCSKKDRKIVFALIVIVFTVQNIYFVDLIESINIYFIFKTIFLNIIPNIIKNILFTYICIYTDCMPAIVYELIINITYWISPILPKTPWVFDSIIDSVFPLILFLYCRYYISLNDKSAIYKLSSPIEPKGTIPLVIGVILIIWFSLGIFPIKPIGIASGSMQPEISVGDLVIVKKCNANEIKVNDIIEFAKNDFSVIHRVVDIYQENGEFIIITKGDNNDKEDSDPVKEEQLEGKVIVKIKYLALPTIWLENLSGRQADVERDF